jgi:antirestriction protein
MSNITFHDGAESIADAPRIYAACLASYNTGRLYGKWIDCDGKDGDDIRAEIAKMLRGSPHPNVMVVHPDTGEEVPSAEEWAIHHHENFAGLITTEWPDLDEVAAMAEGLALNDSARLCFLFLVHDRNIKPSEALDKALEVCIHQTDTHDLAADYAQELFEDTCDHDDRDKLSQWPFTCIDWEAAGRELLIGGDVELCDIDGARFLVSNPGGF